MNVSDAFYDTVHAYPGGAESLAPRLKMTAGLLRNKANPNCASNSPLLVDADRVMTIAGNYAILHALAANHGHVCIQVDTDVPTSDLAVLELVTQVWRSNGDVGAAVDAALADHRVHRRDIDKVRDAIYRHQQAMLTMLKRLEDLCEPDPRSGPSIAPPSVQPVAAAAR